MRCIGCGRQVYQASAGWGLWRAYIYPAEWEAFDCDKDPLLPGSRIEGTHRVDIVESLVEVFNAL
jgi:hypothetical protein